ncbi:MAG: response regulator [Acidobacteria bacterium]|nr:response regulator [Acidobacteriota bacterium]
MASLKVLLVDDEPSIRLTMGEFLKRAGYEVLTASDGDQADALIKADDIDIAVIDINLPRRSGIELLQALSRREPFVPVIMMTGEPNLSQVPDIVRAGAYDFVAKPVVKDTILRTVARAAEKKRLSDEKQRLEREIKKHAEELERRVEERTAELAEAHSFLNLVLDSSTEYAIVAVGTDYRITLFNRGAELLFGYAADEARGRLPRELFVDVTQTGVNVFRECLREADAVGHYQTEIHLHRSDRTEFVASVAVTPIRTPDGRQLGYLCVLRDLTAEREAEASLRRMQTRLAHHEKIAALGRVAAQVAHEVKNPLAGLLLYSMHMKNKLAAKLSESEMELADKIIETINHLINTVEQIMDFARPLNLTLSKVNLNAVVTSVLQLLQPQMAAAGVEPQVSLGEEHLLCAQLDGSSIRAALINFILNAIQAMPGGGRLGVITGRVGARLRVEITDTGSGMTAEQIGQIFEPFYTTKSQGLGLGMPYAKRVVEQHRGTISVESRPGEGTRIRVELPIEEEGATAGCPDTKFSSLTTRRASPARSN